MQFVEEKNVEDVEEEEEEEEDEEEGNKGESSDDDGKNEDEEEGDEGETSSDDGDDEDESSSHTADEKLVVPTQVKEKKNVLNVNNEVVKMRKEVKRIRSLLIRKLIRQIGALKKKTGTKDEVERNQKRAARLLEEVHCMKKLPPDQVKLILFLFCASKEKTNTNMHSPRHLINKSKTEKSIPAVSIEHE